MKKYKKSFSFSAQQLFLLMIIPAILFFVVLDSRNLLSPVRNGISFLYEPASFAGSELGNNVKEYITTIFSISKFKEEYNNMKIDIYEKDINNAYYQTLLEERNALEKQLNLGNKGLNFFKAKVVGSDTGTLRLNIGRREGVEVGDTVSFGNMFIGLVEQADENGSLVVLPYSKNSSFEVFVTSVGAESGVISENSVVLSKAVLKGVGNHISIENISTTSSVKEGDIVITNDSKVGQYLVVGRLSNLSSNPAETSRSGTVIPFVEYSDLMTVFVALKEGKL